MPDIDLGPGDYAERKPKGWRWRLPWAHSDDNKLPLAMFFVLLGFVAYFFLNLPQGTDFWVCVGVAVSAFCAGQLLQLALRD